MSEPSVFAVQLGEIVALTGGLVQIGDRSERGFTTYSIWEHGRWLIVGFTNESGHFRELEPDRMGRVQVVFQVYAELRGWDWSLGRLGCGELHRRYSASLVLADDPDVLLADELDGTPVEAMAAALIVALKAGR